MSSPQEPKILTGDCSCEDKQCALLDDIDIIRNAPVFAGAPLEMIQLFAYFCRREHFFKGEKILKQGTKADKAFLVITGEVEVFQEHRGRLYNLQALGHMAVFGELALLAQFNWFFNVQAKTETVLLTLDRTSFKNVMAKFPDRSGAIIERIVQLRIKRLENQMYYLLDNIKDEALRPESGPGPQTMIA